MARLVSLDDNRIHIRAQQRLIECILGSGAVRILIRHLLQMRQEIPRRIPSKDGPLLRLQDLREWHLGLLGPEGRHRRHLPGRERRGRQTAGKWIRGGKCALAHRSKRIANIDRCLGGNSTIEKRGCQALGVSEALR
jgi:hypothetical protein